MPEPERALARVDPAPDVIVVTPEMVIGPKRTFRVPYWNAEGHQDGYFTIVATDEVITEYDPDESAVYWESEVD
jgi:hypothetical protein